MANRPTVPLFPAAVVEGIGPLAATCPACGETHPLVLLCGEQVIERAGVQAARDDAHMLAAEVYTEPTATVEAV